MERKELNSETFGKEKLDPDTFGNDKAITRYVWTGKSYNKTPMHYIRGD